MSKTECNDTTFDKTFNLSFSLNHKSSKSALQINV